MTTPKRSKTKRVYVWVIKKNKRLYWGHMGATHEQTMKNFFQWAKWPLLPGPIAEFKKAGYKIVRAELREVPRAKKKTR
jgi:hypothetical protein